MVAGDPVGVGIDGRLVEGVDLGHRDLTAGGPDVVGDPFERGAGPSGQVHGRPLAGEGPGHGAADGATAAVDHGLLAIEQHRAHLVSCVAPCHDDVARPDLIGALPATSVAATVTDPDDRREIDPMKIVRRALFALWVAGVIAGAMRVRGRGGVPPQHGGWQPIDVGEG